MRTLTARPALRWLVPLVVLLAVLASFLVTSRASAKPPLTPISPADLLVKVQGAKVDGLTGTVVQHADLGIPGIPGDSSSAGGQLTSLLTGDHTFRVWYGAPDQARLAVVSEQYAETDVITNGSDVWTWESRTKKATHTTIDQRDQRDQADRKAPAGAPQTPEQVATTVIDKLNPTTEVGPVTTTNVAGRDAYELVMTPKATGSLVTQVRVAVDGETFVPLRVQVFGSGDKPAFDVGYDHVVFGQPDPANFTFKAGDGTTVTEKAAPTRKAPTKARQKELEARKAQADKDTTTVGSGWTSVVVTKLPSDAATSNETARSYLTKLPEIKGSWGTGHVLQGTVVTAILTNDGRLAVGAVKADAVSAALAR